MSLTDIRRIVLVASIMASTCMSPTNVSAQADPEQLPQTVGSILRDYERIRAALAADDGRPIAAAARQIGARAGAARRTVANPSGAHLAAVRASSRRLASLRANDLPALRREFGALSRAVIALIHEHPALARGLFINECPMADQYGRWIQRAAERENPYMGRRMLTCGRQVELIGADETR